MVVVITVGLDVFGIVESLAAKVAVALFCVEGDFDGAKVLATITS